MQAYLCQDLKTNQHSKLGTHSFGALVSDLLPGGFGSKWDRFGAQFRHSGSQVRNAGVSVSGGEVGNFCPILEGLGLKLTMA